MTVRVKICGLTDSEAVQSAVAAGADAVGFVFHEKSPRNLTIEKACELKALVPEHVSKVAVMLHPDAAACAEILQQLQPDVLQTDRDDFDYLQVPDHIRRWPVIRETSVEETDELPLCFVYEGSYSGSGQQVDWAKAARFAGRGNMILAGGLSADNVVEAVNTVRPWGVDVSSAVESMPGVKDRQLIRQFIEAAKSAIPTERLNK